MEPRANIDFSRERDGYSTEPLSSACACSVGVAHFASSWRGVAFFARVLYDEIMCTFCQFGDNVAVLTREAAER